ncbi:hypothetical protein NC652_023197 [Populus alba x Populus x berolinensis]|nr:hypothetical protein NC652_023197 [Populus alba x Populus x berolinensis]
MAVVDWHVTDFMEARVQDGMERRIFYDGNDSGGVCVSPKPIIVLEEVASSDEI